MKTKIQRRRFKNRYRNKNCILLRKTNKNIYLQIRNPSKNIIKEFNTLNIKNNMKYKADKIIELSKNFIKENIKDFYTDIFNSSYRGYVKYILDNIKNE